MKKATALEAISSSSDIHCEGTGKGRNPKLYSVVVERLKFADPLEKKHKQDEELDNSPPKTSGRNSIPRPPNPSTAWNQEDKS